VGIPKIEGINHTKTIKVTLAKLVTERKEAIENRYYIKETIGKGGFGEVKIAQDKVTGQYLAMKIISKKKIFENKLLPIGTIENEIEILKKLDHPNIIKLFEFAKDNENYYLITELCRGGELFDRIIAMKNFSELIASKIMRSILSAISYCHNLKIVHRDLKPENLLFDTDKEDAIIKVIDFGTSVIFGKNTTLDQHFGTVFLTSFL